MEEILLKDICDLENGYAFRSEDYVESSDTLNCRMSNIRPDGTFDILYSAKYLPDEFAEKYEDYLLSDGDLIIAMTDMAGDPKILGVPTVVDTKGYKLLLNQRVGKLRFIKPGVNADYLKLALQSKRVREYLKRFAGGGVQLNVSKKDILNAPVRMRTEEEQNYIADLFRRVLEIKKQREQELLCLDNLIKARFVELFGGCKERRKLSEYAELITKGASPRWQGVEYNDYEEGTLFVTSENVREGYIDYSKKKYLPNTINEILPRSVLKRNDVLVNIVNASIGRAAIYESDELANINQAVALVRLRPGALNVIFLLTFLNSDEAIRSYDRMKVGGDKANLSLKNISDLMVPDVSLEVQNKFADYVKQVDKSKVVVQKSLDETLKLYDSLMQEYFG